MTEMPGIRQPLTPAAMSLTGVGRIAMVAPSLEILGGQGVQANSLAQALRHDGFDVLFIPVNPRFPFGLRWLRRIPVLRTLLNQLLYVVSLAQIRHADVVHVFSASYWSFLLAPVPAILAARLFSKRIVLNYHSGEAPDHLATWGMRVHPWLRMVDEIVVPSRYLQQVFAGHGYRAVVVRNIIDTSAFLYRVRLPLRPRLLSNRNLETHYDVANTLKAYAILKTRWPEATLTIAGYGSEAKPLQEWVAAHEVHGVRFLGRVEPGDMPHIYEEADFFLNSSVIDNQPISILEAFAAGLVVVSTPTGDIAAMIDDHATGTLVPTRSPERMAMAIAALLDNPCLGAMMAGQARNEVEKYTWSRVCNEWTAVYSRGNQ
jgi:glycosyltransferase involved in cell wall biosynthesis